MGVRGPAGGLDGDLPNKKPRTESLIELDDEELLQLAARGPPPPFATSHLHELDPEDEELLRLALATEPASQDDGARSILPRKRDLEDMDVIEGGNQGDVAELAADGNEAPAGAGEPSPPVASEVSRHNAIDSILPLREYMPPLRNAIDVQWPYMTVTGADGERVYVRLTPSENVLGLHGKVDIAGSLRRARGTLLVSGVEDLMAQVEKDQYELALAETAAEVQSQQHGGSASQTEQAPSPLREHNTAGKKKSSGKKQDLAHKSSLWVEKYSPQSFLDLLSDDETNREVVRWLQSWNTCVFGESLERTRRPSKSAKLSKGKGPLAGEDPAADPLGRPHYKAILLCGPPGLGKTTLAHVVARHCGYRPVEINASDDRSGTSMLTRVLDAVEMRSVMGEKRPNCLIIDEIDGAAGGAEGRNAISALLKVITAVAMPKSPDNASDGKPGRISHRPRSISSKKGEDTGQNEEDGDTDSENDAQYVGAARAPQSALHRGGGRSPHRKQKTRPLMRPIICICNDVYAPALRPLRDVVRVFHFRRPSAERLAHRLRMVCSIEGLRAERSTLRMLAERAECDVRSCLNTLQFIAKRQRIVRQTDLVGLGLGQKDMTKGAFQVWGEVLQKKKTPHIIGRIAESDAQRTARLYSMLLDFGENELVVSGLHETLPGLRFFDMGLQRTVQVLSNLQDVDTIMRACHRSGNYGLMRYLPAPMLLLGNLVAGPDRPSLTWPRAITESRRRLIANQALLHQWILGMSPSTATAVGSAGLTMDLLPLLPALTTPALRPVSRHLFSKEEHACVNGLVSTLLSLGLKFSLTMDDAGAADDDDLDLSAQTNRQQGQRSVLLSSDPPIQFQPPVHKLWHFPSAGEQPPQPRRSLAMAARQMVLHELDMEAIRRSDAVRQAVQCQTDQGPAATSRGEASTQPDNLSIKEPPGGSQTRLVTGHVPLNLAQRLRESGKIAKDQAKADAASKAGTWLDQLRQGGSRAVGVSGEDGCRAGSGSRRFTVLYKYHEGYTNAVKRPVLMSELLL